MKKVVLICSLVAVCFSASAQFGKIKIDTKKLGKAAEHALNAVMLSDEEVAASCQEYINWSDANNPVCETTSADKGMKAYADRLEKLIKNHKTEDGMRLDIKVYYVVDQNAFACANGSIRVFAGLMDMLTDGELLGVIGHEMGHIKNGDLKDAWKQAYKIAAAKEAIGSTGSDVAKLTDGQYGQLGEALLNARFSQNQEYAADDYGYNFLKRNGYSPKDMASALRKIQTLQESTDVINALFSSHPDSGKRAARLEALD